MPLCIDGLWTSVCSQSIPVRHVPPVEKHTNAKLIPVQSKCLFLVFFGRQHALLRSYGSQPSLPFPWSKDDRLMTIFGTYRSLTGLAAEAELPLSPACQPDNSHSASTCSSRRTQAPRSAYDIFPCPTCKECEECSG